MKKIALSFTLGLAVLAQAHGEAMLQYFNTDYAEITAKMPELAEAGYSSIWLPPPTKGSGGLSVGYDLWDPFDLGSKDQRGSIRTRYGTEAQLLELIETAHRFGIRVYLDNIMNHRAFDIPGYNADTPIDIYPGLVPEDFHLRVTEDGFYRKWDNTRNWGDAWQVQNLGLADLVDLAQEPGDINQNFGPTEGSTFKKIKFVRQPHNPEYYCYKPDGTYVGFGNVTQADLDNNPGYYSERVEDFLNRAARWLVDRTKCDGLRLDAVKHVRSDFFGATFGADKDTSDYGYLGQIQRQFNLTHGYSDANHRDTVFDTEKPRDDAMVFGEHLGEPPSYGEYVNAGMRLVDNVLRNNLNGILGNPSATLAGLDQPGSYGFPPEQAVMHAQSHDNDYASRRELQHALYFTRAGIGLLYTDGNHHAETLSESGGAFPRHANTAFLGQWGDNRVPNLLSIHEQFARGYQKPAFADNDFVAYERIDKREDPNMTDADGVTLLIMLNDNYASGVGRNFATSFPAQGGTANDAYLFNYSAYGGPFYTYASNLGGVVVPPGGYFVFSWRNPEESDLWSGGGGKPVTILQNGQPVSTLTYTRQDGPDGDPGFNPYGLPDTNATDYAYTITIPRVTDGTNLTFLARADGSAENILLKLDGGMDLNGINHPLGDPRDNPPALATDVKLGYEQPLFVDRFSPELFAAVITATHNTTGAGGAETYTRSIGGSGFTIVTGSGSKFIDGDTAAFLFHDPAASTDQAAAQYSEGATTITLWAESNGVGAGYRVFCYYTTDGSNPAGAGGAGVATTQTAELGYHHNEGSDNWWTTATLPKPPGGTTFKYKIGIVKTGATSVFPANPAAVDKKKKMLTVFDVPSFNATTISYHPHNDYGPTVTGLKEGFHVLRARAFLKRAGGFEPTRASIYSTFLQTFYYDAQRPQGEIKFPATNGESVGGQEYGAVVRTDSTVTEVWYHIDDADANNDDTSTLVGNGNGNGFEPYVDANGNGQHDAGESFTDLNGNGVWDNNIGEGWVRATEVTPSLSITSPYPKEWRFNYVNIPAGGAAATIKVRLRELSSVNRESLAGWLAGSDVAGHYTTLTRTVQTFGPDTRLFVAFPQQDGDTVGVPYTMKVYFSKSLADGFSTQDLINQFLIKIQSSESGRIDGGTPQDRASYTINYNETAQYHALAFPLPNLYNDVPSFLHGIQVTMSRPGGVVLTATRLIKAYPSPSAPFIAIVNPVNVDSDGRPFQIVLPDVANPTPQQRQYDVRVQTGLSGSNVTIHIDYAPLGYTNLLDGMVVTNRSVEGSSQYWDYKWINLIPGQYSFTATVTTTNNATASATRTTTVVLRQLVSNCASNADDCDNDGISNDLESTPTALPTTNPETWVNSDVHKNFFAGKTDPMSVDTDGDGLPDGLELGIGPLPAATNTDLAADSNGDGEPNFRPDADPPKYNTYDNSGLAGFDANRSRTDLIQGSVTDPSNPDTDYDGLLDGLEDANHNGRVDIGLTNSSGVVTSIIAVPPTSRNSSQVDQTALPDNAVFLETDPNNPDTDGDGLADGTEDANHNGQVDIGLVNASNVVTGLLANPPTVTFAGMKSRRVDRAALAAQYPNAVWLETDPLNPDTDGDGLPDGWEVAHGLDPWDDGIIGHTNLHTHALITTTTNGAAGDPDGDGFSNIQELANGTDPRVPDTGVPPNPNSIHIGPVLNPVIRGSVTNFMEFTDWTANDLIVLDEYDGAGLNNQGSDVYHAYDGFDTSRDIVAFYARDGGAVAQGGDGNFYFRVDLHDLQAYAEDANLDIYVVIDTGNPAVGESALPDDVDTRTEMKWEAVVACYGRNNGRVYLDTDHGNNSTSIDQNLADFGVVVRDQNTANGFGKAYFSSELDAVEFSISRQALLDAGWNGLNPAQLNYQVFTTKDGTQNNPRGAGDIGGRSDIRDTIYDDWIASDYWKDQPSIAGNGSVLRSWFGLSGANDRGKRAKVMLLAYGNQSILPGNQIQAKINNGSGAGYYRPFDVHDAYGVPLSLQLTPATASTIQWAKVDPAAGKPWRDGPALNQHISTMITSNVVDLLGTTFAGQPLAYFPDDFNSDNIALADDFLQRIYGKVPSQKCFVPAERVVDSPTLSTITGPLGFQYTFVDQMRHVLKWFGRTSALGDDGYRINQINGSKVFVINDQASSYRFQNTDRGLPMPLRQLLLRKAQSETQDQVVILFSDLDDFTNKANADAYDLNVRWLASHPWIQIVTPDQIANGGVDVTRDFVGDTWGVRDRGTGLTLPKVAKDYVDYATLENYDNWYNGLPSFRESLRDKTFNIRNGAPLPAAFGRVGVNGIASQAWARVSGLGSPLLDQPLGELARGVLHSAMFLTAFHDQSPVDLSKFSTGDYVNPATGFQNLSAAAKNAQAQARFAAIFSKVAVWGNAPPGSAVAEAADIDLDGENEYLLYNARLFAVFERSGGRLIAAFARDPASGTVRQVIGNQLSNAGTETEDEGNVNVLTGDAGAYRTSGFKDWFAQTGGPGVGSIQYVNDRYTVTNAVGGTGWQLTSSDGNIRKVIRLATGSTALEATYTLGGGVNTLYVRHGLSPDLFDLLVHGQANLTGPLANGSQVTVRNLNPAALAVATVNYAGAGHSNVVFNATAVDDAPATVNFDTIPMRNQAQTQQIELAGTNSTFSFGMDLTAVDCGTDTDHDGLSDCAESVLGTDPNNPDTDGDGMNDAWEALYRNPLAAQSGNVDPDGDGMTDLQESIAGTNPDDPHDVLKIVTVLKDGSGAHLTWTSKPGKQYQIWSTTNLTGTVFGFVKGPINSGGSLTADTVPSPAPTREFYKIKVLP